MLAPFFRRAMLVGADMAGSSRFRSICIRFATSCRCAGRKHGLQNQGASMACALQGACGAIWKDSEYSMALTGGLDQDNYGRRDRSKGSGRMVANRILSMSGSVSLLMLLIALGACSREIEPRPSRVPGSRIVMTAPQGFALSGDRRSFWNGETFSFIRVHELRVPLEALLAGYISSETLRQKSRRVLRREELTLGGHTGVLLFVDETTVGTTFYKWILLLGDEQESVAVVATFPASMQAAMAEPLRASLLTARWARPTALANPTNFTVNEHGDLRLAHRLANILMYSRGGTMAIDSPDDPIFIIGPSFSSGPIENRRAFARHRILSMSGLAGVEVREIAPVEIDSLDGFEIVATGADAGSSAPMILYQAILYQDPVYYLMQGVVSAQHADDYLESFKTMAHSFRRKQ